MTPAERSAKFKAAHPERVVAFNAKYYADHPERVKASNEKWRRENPEKVLAYQRAYLAAHREEAKAKGRRWYARHRTESTIRHAAYAARNRELMSMIQHRRRVKAEGNGVFKVTARDWRRVLSRYRNACAYCGKNARLFIDHVQPIHRGGRHSIGNLVPACRPCNGSKGKKLLVEWRYR